MMSRKFINHILLAYLFSLFIPSVSFADIPGGPPGKYSYLASGTPSFTWEVRNGNVYILTNSITINLQQGSSRPGLPCSSTGCSIIFHSDKYQEAITYYGGASLAELRSVIGKRGPLSTRHTGASYLCIIYSDWSNRVSQVYPADCLTGGAGTPPISPPDPPLSCSINGGVIRHGEVSLAALSGHRADTNLQISCNRRASVRITASGYNKSGLSLQGSAGSLNTLIKVQGVPLENGVTMTVNNIVNVNVSSELRSSDNVTPSGFYSGSVILVATFN